VRRIDLIDTSIDDRGFESILTGFSQLTELVYFRPTDETETDFDMIGGVLKEYGQRLEHLQMHNVSLMPFYTPVGSLHTCTSLKTLNMDLELLVGFHENPRGGHNEYLDASIEEDEEPLIYDEIYDEVVDWSLVKLLPTSLVKLTLWVEEPKIDAYYNTYERYGAKFEELLTSDDHSQNLQSVTASFLEPVAEKLRGTLTGWVMDGSTMVRMPTANMAVVASGVTDVEPITDDEEGS
jgi:hypothetical protein